MSLIRDVFPELQIPNKGVTKMSKRLRLRTLFNNQYNKVTSICVVLVPFSVDFEVFAQWERFNLIVSRL